jgi:uncharacterized membrane protein YjgN (DUF898 family)
LSSLPPDVQPPFAEDTQPLFIESAAPAPPAEPSPFTFTGKAGEYFRIWIVNLFLTVVTLGIYSAWATVRKRRYFYGHSWLAGTNFEYHGDPKVILRGRLIAVALFLAYTLIGRFSPRLAAAAAVLALPVAPWLLVRSFRFNAVNTSWRNVRFHFEGRYREFLTAILPVAVFPLVTMIFGQVDTNGSRQPTLGEMVRVFLPLVVFGLLYPWMSGRLHVLRVNGSRFGAAPFHCTARVGLFYGLYILAWLLSVVLVFVMLAPVFALLFISKNDAVLFLVPVAYLAFFAIILGYTRSRISNTMFNNTTLGGSVTFTSRLKARRLAWVYFGNLFAIVCTAGLLIPWAAVRVARVRAEALHVVAPDGIEHFVAAAASDVGATGQEVVELFAFDVAF